MTPALVAGAIVAVIVLAVLVINWESWVPIWVIGLTGALGYFALTRKSAKTPAAAKPKIITHVITHVVTRPGKPTLSGTEITVIICVGLVLGLAYLLTRKGN